MEGLRTIVVTWEDANVCENTGESFFVAFVNLERIPGAENLTNEKYLSLNLEAVELIKSLALKNTYFKHIGISSEQYVDEFYLHGSRLAEYYIDLKTVDLAIAKHFRNFK